MTDVYFKTHFAIKPTIIFYMKKITKSFLTYTPCFLITRRHAGSATVNFDTLALS